MTPAGSDPLRIGCVKYLNALPLIHGWPGPVDFDHPAKLCRKLAESELDVALVSSFEFLRNPVYTIVDEVGLGSRGAVYSVVLAHAGALPQVEEVVLDPASFTSVSLLRCLLAERGLGPRFLSPEAAMDETVTTKRAKLLIGDQAIRFRDLHATDCKFWDLGAAWKESTGLPFVFALWLIRPEVNGARSIADSLRRRRDENLASLDQVIAAQAKFSPEFCAHYFRDCLRYEFGDAEKEGLSIFRSLCQRHGILPPGTTPFRLA